jgi:hippurate hydrolase
MRIAGFALLFVTTAWAQDVSKLVSTYVPGLVETYKHLHAHPELSRTEVNTAALLAGELRKFGYTVTERVGKYSDGTQAYGVVGILENGPGPRLLIRGDMDGLPIVEETGLSYASKVKTKNAAGQDVGVMHACGHDVHVTTLIGVARALAELKGQWHGTVMLVGQPAEETVEGARAMLADRLYERFGVPTMGIALHDTAEQPAGSVSISNGPALASATSLDVTIRGLGSHGSRPDLGKDPIVMAAQFITQIQTIVSRQEDPREPVVVTVGQIHAGTKRNIIPDEAKLEITMRAFSERARETALSGIRRAAKGVAIAAGIPDALEPVITILEHESVPVTYNDPGLAARVKSTLARALGAAQVMDAAPLLASEDFGLFGLEGHKIPTVLFWLGAIDPAKFAAAKASNQSLPGFHNSHFEPSPEPTLRTGVLAMTSVALSLLQP